MMWRRLHADGTDWEARIVARTEIGPAGAPDERSEVIEFHALDGMHPPRRIAVRQTSLAAMEESELRNAYRSARPIGGDYYGRPGKWMNDTRSAELDDAA